MQPDHIKFNFLPALSDLRDWYGLFINWSSREHSHVAFLVLIHAGLTNVIDLQVDRSRLSMVVPAWNLISILATWICLIAHHRIWIQLSDCELTVLLVRDWLVSDHLAHLLLGELSMWTFCVLQASSDVLRCGILKSVNLLVLRRYDSFARGGISYSTKAIRAASILLRLSWMVIVYVDWLLIQPHQILCLKV